jgi:hypothetical protein
MTPDDAKKRTEELNSLLEVRNPDVRFFTASLLQDIDKAAAETFGVCRMLIGISVEEYTDRLTVYMRSAIRSLDEHRAGHPLLESAKGKLRWLMFQQDDAKAPFPIVTEAVVGMLAESFSHVGKAINEVSCRHFNSYFSCINGQPRLRHGSSRFGATLSCNEAKCAGTTQRALSKLRLKMTKGLSPKRRQLNR